MQRFTLGDRWFLCFVLFINIFTVGCSMFGIRTSEELRYETIIAEDNKEIRRYSEYIIAQVTVDDQDSPQNRAFRILAGYIFGDNKSKSKVAMTAPVVTQSEAQNEKIAMTAPVMMKPTEGNQMTMSFSMPSQYRLEDLPEPNDKRISLVSIPAHYMAALRFSGLRDKDKNARLAEELGQWLAGKPAYKAVAPFQYAGYDPPWTLPFLRRNEILIEVEKIN